MAQRFLLGQGPPQLHTLPGLLDQTIIVFLQSTDDKWVPTVIREAATVIYKVREREEGAIHSDISCRCYVIMVMPFNPPHLLGVYLLWGPVG